MATPDPHAGQAWPDVRRLPSQHTLVRMMDHVAGPALLDGHVQCVQDEIGLQVGPHRPAHDAPGKRVEHDRQIQEAGPGRDVKPAPVA